MTLPYVLIGSLLPGVLLRIPVLPGVAIYLHDLVIPVIMVWFTIVTRKNTARAPFLLPPLSAFVLAAIISLLANANRYQGTEIVSGALYLVRFVLYSLPYIVLAAKRTDGRYWTPAITGFGSVFAAGGLLQMVLYPDLRNLEYLGWDPHFRRLFSSVLDPNFAAIILTICLLWTIAAGIRSRWNYAAAMIMGVAVILTYSRSGLAALTIGMLVLGFRAGWKRMGVAAILVPVAVIIAVFAAQSSTLSLLRGDTAFARLGNWQWSMDLIQGSPVFGYGFNMLRSVITPGWVSSGNVSHAGAGMDNSLLFIWLTSGIPGLAAFGWLIARLTGLVRNVRYEAKFRSGLAAILSAVGIHGMFNNSWFFPWVIIPVFVIAAVTENSRINGGT